MECSSEALLREDERVWEIALIVSHALSSHLTGMRVWARGGEGSRIWEGVMVPPDWMDYGTMIAGCSPSGMSSSLGGVDASRVG